MGVATATRRLVLEVAGWTLIVAGLAALVLPGPGLLLLFGGLAVLAEQYPWAERRLEPVRDQALKTAADGVRSIPRLLMSLTSVAVLAAAGVIWGLRPDQPHWWPLDDRWWLPGGWSTGGALLLSAAVALALLAYSWRLRRRSLDSPA